MRKEYNIKRRFQISFQRGWNGARHEISLPGIVLGMMLIAVLGLFFLSLLYIFSLKATRNANQSLEKLKHENRLLREKLDFYSSAVDSIFQKLDSLEVKSTKLRQHPYYAGTGSVRETKIVDNSFVYDIYLDAAVNSLDNKLTRINENLRQAKQHPAGRKVASESALRQEENTPGIFPTFGRFTDGWGVRIHPFYRKLVFHYGLDIANKAGTPIYATSDGYVSEAGFDSEYGKLIKISHDYDYETRYGHLSNFLVNRGDKVKKGQIIGLMGSTGMSTGPHLHYEIRLAGTRVNPANYLNRIEEPVYYAKR